MKAVVMAGGEGSRLRPLTLHRPKPLVPVVNKPVMQHILELLAHHGIRDIVVTLHYLAEEIEEYFGDGSEFGVNLEYTVEDTPLGTAGSVKKAQHLLRDDTFLIISGDALTDVDLTALIQYHRERRSLATLCLTRVESPLEYGVVITDNAGRIRRFLEKPEWSEVFSDTVNTGIYVLEPEVLDYMEPEKVYD
jgi:mannose-1-phosphate guanylyltransferase/phosphomannomutase